MSTRQDLITEIEQNQEHYLAFLQRFIRAASPNPPGNTTEATKVIEDFLSERDVGYQIIAPLEHAPNLVADFEGGKGEGQRVIFNGHIDTFPVEKPEDWERGPYSGDNDGTSIHGRGGVDMKAGTAASIIAFTLLRKRAANLKGSVGLAAVSDEETGGKWGTRYLLENCGDPSPWLGDCVLNGEPVGLQSIRFGEKGTLRMTFTVNTHGHNGAYTFLGRGANVVAYRLGIKLLELEDIEPDYPDEFRKHFESDKFRQVADEIMGSGAADSLIKPTVNIGTHHGGVKVNTIPEQCVFEADIRLPIGLDSKTVLARIDDYLKDFPEASYVIQEAATNPTNFCTPDHPFADCITKCAEEVTGTKPVMITSLGATDGKFYRYRGVPTYQYGPTPKGMGASGEAVSIKEYLALIKTYTLAVWDFLAVTGI